MPRVSQKTCLHDLFSGFRVKSGKVGRALASDGPVYIFLMKKLLIPAFLLLLFPCLLGNNVRIRNSSLASSNLLRFEIAWDNSWELTSAPFSHDAIWVFAKYKNAYGEWKHLDLASATGDHISASSDLTIIGVSDGKGVFVKRAFPGSGNIPFGQLELKCAAPVPANTSAVRIFAIEMVHIPEEAFYLGDTASNDCFRRGDVNEAFHVTSEVAINVGTSGIELYGGGSVPPGGPIPVDYPKGYEEFYVMKYELSQDQYTGFLNCLSYDQQVTRTATSPESSAGTFALASGSGFRNGIVIEYSGTVGFSPARYGLDGDGDGQVNEPEDGGTRACNWLKWDDLAAYLDWAALKPLTEFQFEKVCRGPLQSVPLEFAWGTSIITDANTVMFDGTPDEMATDTLAVGAGLGSHGYAGPQGPLRSGFGASSGSDRLQAGAGYYGVFELSGNVWELCVAVTASGLVYDGSSGDGLITEDGFADVPSWPGAAGCGHRGGAWNSGIIPGFRDLAISDRFYIGLKPEVRRNTVGGRGGR